MKLVEIIYNVVWGVAAMMLLAPSRHQTKNTKVTNSTDDLSVSARTDVGKIYLYERSRMFFSCLEHWSTVSGFTKTKKQLK
jgi:hypothetical protein